jgi:arsenite methyltransferase
VQLPDGIVCNSTLWAARIGSAMQQDDYRSAIEAAGLRIRTVRGQSKLPVHLR